MDLASFFFGIFVGIFIFAFAKLCQQTRSIWTRTRSLHNAYLYLIWGEAICNLIFAIFTILFLIGVLEGSTAYFAIACILWSTQVELLPQIIANRVALIMTDKRKAQNLKNGLALLITPLCITVCYVFTTAHSPGASATIIRVNFALENAEKVFFLIIDLALNLYFLYLVRYRLIADGLTKYWKLFHFNIGMVIISTCLDGLLLGLVNLTGHPYTYVQFAPLAYTSKLYIELLMANLISKVVRSSANVRNEGWHSSRDKSHPTDYITSRSGGVTGGTGTRRGPADTIISRLGKSSPVGEGSNSSEVQLATYPEPHGITKTVETTIVVDDDRLDLESDKAYNQHAGAYDGAYRTSK